MMRISLLDKVDIRIRLKQQRNGDDDDDDMPDKDNLLLQIWSLYLI